MHSRAMLRVPPPARGPSCPVKGHVKGRHRTMNRDAIVGPTGVLIWDPCPFGLPELLTAAQVTLAGFLRYRLQIFRLFTYEQNFFYRAS